MQIYNQNISFIVEEEDLYTRIDKFILDKLQSLNYDVTRNLIQKNLDCITVNKKKIKKNYSVKLNDRIDIFIPKPERKPIIASSFEIPIVYEDDDIIVINKPYGMVVHPAKTHNENTVVHALIDKIDHNANIGGDLRPGIVHRLDKDTSGLMVVARTERAYHKLIEGFTKKTINKIYHAIIKGRLPESICINDSPIMRHPKYRKKFKVGITGKKAITEFQMLREINSYSLVMAKPLTGRTHQIRVHLSSLYCPILGDPIYSKLSGKEKNLKLMLVAKKLSFMHPTKNEEMKFNIEYPSHFKEYLDKSENKLI